MKAFVSFADLFSDIIQAIIANPKIHLKWLNTLSYMENCGARKIAACEHPTLVKEEMLKHAAEEFRHAHYLKRQMGRVSQCHAGDYTLPNLLGGTASLHYLTNLDLYVCRYLSKGIGLSKREMKESAYLLVTYAIELRAGELYPIYDQLLRNSGSKVAVRSIVLEEKEHLQEMEEGLLKLPSGYVYAQEVCRYESSLCKK